ncbi:MAG: hypothetical protein DRJ40_05900 [Thermoprotei archaeon]|nr:MAG: hypothetical protein DRJ40_05900 [Thermoprotei archaeon]
MEFEVTVKNISETPIKGVVLIECESKDGRFSISFEYPRHVLGKYVDFSVGDELLLALHKEKTSELDKWDVYMHGMVYHVRDIGEGRKVFYISIWGYQVRLCAPEQLLNLYDKVYIGIKKLK